MPGGGDDDDDDDAIDTDLPCVRCGYLLRGLKAGGSCPECDTAIRHSVRTADLIDDDPLYVGRLRLAATLDVCVAVLIAVAHLLFLWNRVSVGTAPQSARQNEPFPHTPDALRPS